ncbi:hypothetical protein [Candidatus Nitronereus thalassa]|uniref:Uncharacterized protein n=1 Tax=Candidatus Nitronereus thalassa TaxID=3020898 RepID=A0ABU3K370_9BACT|nr:hypothetical protein [Candidatus Nitronereus thalassa]MDT7040832.1 hypothetical protein [Candidatus Nitronereus thalassa]
MRTSFHSARLPGRASRPCRGNGGRCIPLPKNSRPRWPPSHPRHNSNSHETARCIARHPTRTPPDGTLGPCSWAFSFQDVVLCRDCRTGPAAGAVTDVALQKIVLGFRVRATTTIFETVTQHPAVTATVMAFMKPAVAIWLVADDAHGTSGQPQVTHRANPPA